MSHPCEDIADAIVEFLNSRPTGTFTYSFNAYKPDDPNGELDKADDNVRVIIWPHSESEVKNGRGGTVMETFSIAMLVIRKLAADFSPAALNSFCRELKGQLRGVKQAGRIYVLAETTMTDLEQLHEHKRIAVATILSYRGPC